MFDPITSTGAKFGVMLFAIVLFVAIVGFILFLADRLGNTKSDRAVATLFLLPTVVLITLGLLYPAVRTIYQSFLDENGRNFVGLDNYATLFTESEQRIVLRNTFIWVLITPFLATFIGLVYSILVDRIRGEAVAKALIFLPMAISMVGASIIWKFVYEFRPADVDQIGLVNQILVLLHIAPQQLIITTPWNTLLLIVVVIWIQAGFAMTVLSASIKAIPDDMNEAASLDGVNALERFRFITVPSIRPALIVVLTTIAIGTLKAFDIVRTMTGGQFETSVIANEFYTQAFRNFNSGLGAALAVALFILVIPIVVYNIRQLRQSEAR
ncbi:MAG: sugar ABC transporter permease [Kineosporiaceae bacterium]